MLLRKLHEDSYSLATDMLKSGSSVPRKSSTHPDEKSTREKLIQKSVRPAKGPSHTIKNTLLQATRNKDMYAENRPSNRWGGDINIYIYICI